MCMREKMVAAVAAAVVLIAGLAGAGAAGGGNEIWKAGAASVSFWPWRPARLLFPPLAIVAFLGHQLPMPTEEGVRRE